MLLAVSKILSVGSVLLVSLKANIQNVDKQQNELL